MVEEPEVDRHHIVNEHKVAHLAALRVATVFAEELDLAFCVELVELVEGHTGHAALVLLAWAIDVEITEAHDLVSAARLGALKIRTTLAAHALIEQQLGVAIHIERRLKGGVFAEGVGAAISGGT